MFIIRFLTLPYTFFPHTLLHFYTFPYVEVPSNINSSFEIDPPLYCNLRSEPQRYNS